MTMVSEIQNPADMLYSTTGYLAWGLVTPFRDVCTSKSTPLVVETQSLNYGRVVAAEFGYAVLLVAATVETVVRGALSILAYPFLYCGCLPMAGHRQANKIGDHVFYFTIIGTMASALTVMNCATALLKNLYEPKLSTSDFCMA